MTHPPADRSSATPSPPPEGDPAARLDAGDARTLAVLYDRHAGLLYSLAMRITGEPADAAAVVREVLAAAWSEAGSRAGGYAPDVHRLLATTRVRAIARMRATGARGEATAPSATGAAGDDVPTDARAGDVATLRMPVPAHGGAADVPGPGDAPRLRATFRRLPPLERLSIELAYFEGLTLSQIATRLEQAPAAANARVRTGLQRLARRGGPRRMGEPRHDEPATRELAGLYALGVLNAAEGAAFDAHLEVHRESVDEVLSLLPVARRLAWTAPPHEPPSGLRARIVEAVTGAPLPGAPERKAAGPSRQQDAGVRAKPRTERRPEPGDDGGSPETAQMAGGPARRGYRGRPEPVNPGDYIEPPEDGSGTERAHADLRLEPVEAADEPAPMAGPRPAPRSTPAGDVEKAAEPAPQVGPRTAPRSTRAGDVEKAAEPAPMADERARFAPAPSLQEAPPPTEQASRQPRDVEPRAAGEAAPPMEQATPTAQRATPTMPKPTPTVQSKGGRWGLLSLAVGSLVVAGSLGVFVVRQASLATALQENLDAANTQARLAELETASAQRVADELRGGVRILTAADVQTLDLGGQPAAPVARGRLFWSASTGALLTATGLPPTPPGRVYQLWLVPDATPVNGGLLSVDEQGSVMAAVTPPEGVTEPVPVAITLEPTGGARTPGGEVYLLGQP